MNKVLLAGATGYLGSHIAKALDACSLPYRALARSQRRLLDKDIATMDVHLGELTEPDTLRGCCDAIDVVISTVGITRQKDGLSYMDVDYQANLNLLREAQRSGVEKFIYVSVLHGQALRKLKICDAKERFVEALQRSGMDYCVIRPNGFFQDMSEFLAMARRGRVYLLGTGDYRTNPIDGADLAAVCLDAIDSDSKDIEVGGPQVLTHTDIATQAFAALGKEPRITRIPIWVTRLTLGALRTFTSSRTYGPIEFFLTVMAMDMVAPTYGSKTLAAYFEESVETVS